MSSARARGIAVAVPLLMAGWLTAFAVWAEVGQKKECATDLGGGCKGPDQQQAPPQPPYDHDDGTRGLDGTGDDVSPPSLMDDRDWTPELGEELGGRLEDCARQQQQMADALRGGRRRVSHPELNASECLDLDRDPGLYGGFLNHCDYDVLASYCAYRPHKDSWTTSFDCEQQEGGMFDVPAKTAQGPGRRTVHTHGAQMIYWAACRMPGASLVDVKFVPGKGLTFRCEIWEKVASPPRVPEIIPGCTADVVEDVIHDREELLRLGREEEERVRAAEARAALAQQQAALRQRQDPPQRQAGIDAAPAPQPAAAGAVPGLDGDWRGDNAVTVTLTTVANGFNSAPKGTENSSYFARVGADLYRFDDGPNHCLVRLLGSNRFDYSCNGTHIAFFDRDMPSPEPARGATNSTVPAASAQSACVASASLCAASECTDRCPKDSSGSINSECASECQRRHLPPAPWLKQ